MLLVRLCRTRRCPVLNSYECWQKLRKIIDRKKEEKQMEKITNIPQDWELSEDFYNQEEGKKWKLEDFLEEDSGKQEKAPGLNTAAETGARLEEMAELVRQVTVLSGQGNTADQIAGALGVERKLVQDIMVCLQAFPEDNPVAVARLIVLG